MSERPLIFTSESVRGLLAGTKTQTRRLVKPQPVGGVRQSPFVPSGLEDGHGRPIRVPWSIGDRIWVRETFNADWCDHVIFKDDGGSAIEAGWPKEPHWKSPFFLKRADSRITLEITDMRVQRLRDITPKDAWAEGLETVGIFAIEWDIINGKTAPWSSDPWVFALSFAKLTHTKVC